ncbi:MAG: DUF2156 domain-containing protein [Geobacteraceae bacterium]|nr:DUF2156 domain-containing protein [Geobacteraceae bacterium]
MTAQIPQYPASRPINISDRELLTGFFREIQPSVSELSFANIFLFREIHQYRLTTVKGSLVILGCGYDSQPYVLPPLCGDRSEAARYMLSQGNTLYGADQRFITEHLSEEGCTIVADRDNDDYLYLKSNLADLPGKLYHKKKNRINYFSLRNSYTVEPYSKRHQHSSLGLLHGWEMAHSQYLSRSMTAEVGATREGVERADELGLEGVVVLTERGVSAFALGERLNTNTFVCHFEKSDPFLEGLAQLVNREFCRSLTGEYIYVNREQDLGESGLKAAKSSYHPIDMVRKYRVNK